MLIKIATWNMGAAILGESHQTEGVSNLDYARSVIAVNAPDIICLQEAHSYEDGRKSQTEELAERLGYKYFYNAPISRSHLEKGASLSLGIISRFPLSETTYTQLPNANLTATGPNGQPWVLFDKGFVTSTLDIDGVRVGLITLHGFPFHYFGASATEEQFANVWQMLNEAVFEKWKQAPLLMLGDFNVRDIAAVMSPSLDKHLCNAFVADTTKEGQQDYILYDRTFRLMNTLVIATQTDHSYCQATVSIS